MEELYKIGERVASNSLFILGHENHLFLRNKIAIKKGPRQTTILSWSQLVRVEVTLSLEPHHELSRTQMSTASSMKFTCVTMAIRKTLGEPKVCLTYSHLSSSEKP